MQSACRMPCRTSYTRTWPSTDDEIIFVPTAATHVMASGTCRVKSERWGTENTRRGGGEKRARDAPEASDMTSVAAFSRDLRSHIRTCAPRHSSHVTPGRRRLSAITLRSSLPPIMSVLSWAKSRELTFMPNPFKWRMTWPVPTSHTCAERLSESAALRARGRHHGNTVVAAAGKSRIIV